MVRSLPKVTALQCNHPFTFSSGTSISCQYLLPRSFALSNNLCENHTLPLFRLLPGPEFVETYAMYTDVSQCPENSNSTDCLLRSLLEFLTEYREAENAAVDWDPINFAFTLLIGIIAVLFALATIIQAIFTAGKGRRRTSHLAIGRWSAETKRKWDWSEMNFQFTVTTPVLHEKAFQSMLWKFNKKEHDTGKHSIRKAV